MVISTLSLHDALPIFGNYAYHRTRHCCTGRRERDSSTAAATAPRIYSRRRTAHAKPESSASATAARSEEHTSELQSLRHLVCRLLLEKKKINKKCKR